MFASDNIIYGGWDAVVCLAERLFSYQILSMFYYTAHEILLNISKLDIFDSDQPSQNLSVQVYSRMYNIQQGGQTLSRFQHKISVCKKLSAT